MENIENMKIVDKGLYNEVKINKNSAEFQNSSITILGNNNSVMIESRCLFKNFNLIIRGDNNDIVIRRAAWFLGGSISIANNCTLSIGERSSFGQRLDIIIDRAVVSIGNDCMVASGLNIRTTDTHGIYSLNDGKVLNRPQNVEVGDYVWIGRDVTILKGAKVADGNIIALKSLFTKCSSPFECWGGTPAKKLKENVIWSKSGNLDNITQDKYAMFYMKKYGKLIPSE